MFILLPKSHQKHSYSNALCLGSAQNIKNVSKMCPYIKTPKLKLFLKTIQKQSTYGMIFTFFS